MIKLRQCGKGFLVGKLFTALSMVFFLPTATPGANNITGTVQNQTRGQPAAGDEVILLRLDSGMEEARAKTGAHGDFTLAVRYPHKPYLVRVFHQKVNYDQWASGRDTLSIQVFDAAPQVRGVTGSIEILRAGTNGKQLHISDLYEIKNESSPPLTQAGEHTFEVYLPASAKMDSVLAAGPGKTAEVISAMPVPGQPGHYVVSFPLRPGATKFAFNYDLTYDGHASFRTRHAYPLQQLAVMIPQTMKFSSSSLTFETLATGSSEYQVQAANQLKAGDGPAFEVSGTGALPPLGKQAKSQARPQSPPVRATASAPGLGTVSSLARIDIRLSQSQSPSQFLVIVGLTAVLLAVCALLLWRARRTRTIPSSTRN